MVEIYDEGWPLVAPHRWYAAFHKGNWYALACDTQNPKGTKLRMHNVILGTKPVDHRDGED